MIEEQNMAEQEPSSLTTEERIEESINKAMLALNHLLKKEGYKESCEVVITVDDFNNRLELEELEAFDEAMTDRLRNEPEGWGKNVHCRSKLDNPSSSVILNIYNIER